MESHNVLMCYDTTRFAGFTGALHRAYLGAFIWMYDYVEETETETVHGPEGVEYLCIDTHGVLTMYYYFHTLNRTVLFTHALIANRGF